MTQMVPQTFARLLDATAAGLHTFGLRAPELSVEALVADAARVSGCAPPTDGRYREPLGVILDAAQDAGTLNALGRWMLAKALSMRLRNHFAISAWLEAHPEIHDEPIERPVFIVSLPRTGTTMLHRLLSVDPANRSLQTWEMDHPVPSAPRGPLAPPPAVASAAGIQILHQMCPDLRHIHDVQADVPEECTHLLANELTTTLFTCFYELPGYIDYLHQTDLEPAYRAHRRQLQLHQHRAGRRRRWVLKAPAHLLGLDALLRVYPDALIIQTHRDPSTILASEASLNASVRRAFHTTTDLDRLGQERLGALGTWIDRGMQARDRHGDAAFLDIPYRALVRDPLPWVERIAEQLGTPLTDAAHTAMTQHLAMHRQHRHGKHRYSLAQFGLEEDTVRQRFAAYTERFSSVLHEG